MKLRLTLHIEYKTRAAVLPDLREQLNRAAEHLLDNGLLTGSLDAEVHECTHEVAEDVRPVIHLGLHSTNGTVTIKTDAPVDIKEYNLADPDPDSTDHAEWALIPETRTSTEVTYDL